jgi:prepilin-type N-terminal cleavage/methylation domain-containing protein
MLPIHASRRLAPLGIERAASRRQPRRSRSGGARRCPTPNPRSPSRGFTLTELLVVIAIIAMLVAITSVAVMRGLDTAKQTRIKVEVDQLDTAFKNYKEKYGSYPPWDWRIPGNGTGTIPPQLIQHIAQAFPRYNMGPAPNYPILRQDLIQTGIDVGKHRADQALVFWLRGFSNDPLHPFVRVDDHLIVNGTATAQTVKRTPFFEFDESRLMGVIRPIPPNDPSIPEPNWKTAVITAGVTGFMPSYFPQGVAPGVNGGAYIYFDAGNYGTSTQPTRFNNFTGPPPVKNVYADAGVVVPYWHDVNGNGISDATENWVNPDSFQIIAPGGDGAYGDPGVPNQTVPSLCRMFPTGVYYDPSINQARADLFDKFDGDNVTNFCSQARLGSAKP